MKGTKTYTEGSIFADLLEIGCTHAVANQLIMHHSIVTLQRYLEYLPFSEGYRKGEKNAGLFRQNLELEEPPTDEYIRHAVKREAANQRNRAEQRYEEIKKEYIDGKNQVYAVMVAETEARNRVLTRLSSQGEVYTRMLRALIIDEIALQLSAQSTIYLRESEN